MPTWKLCEMAEGAAGVEVTGELVGAEGRVVRPDSVRVWNNTERPFRLFVRRDGIMLRELVALAGQDVTQTVPGVGALPAVQLARIQFETAWG